MPQTSRLMLLPNLAYNTTLSDSISPLTLDKRASMADTSASIWAVDVSSNDWASESGRRTKESPSL